MKHRRESKSPAENDLFPKDCSCARLRRTARIVTQAYDRALKPVGLRVTQYSVLVNLEGRGPLALGELAERMVMDRTTLTRNLRPMEAAGWIESLAGVDRRSREVRITAAGQAVLERARPLWRSAERALRCRLGDADAATLHRVLDATRRAAPDIA